MPMYRFTTFRIGGPADYLVYPASLSGLIDLIGALKQRCIPWILLGGGSNLLVSDQGIRGVVISLSQLGTAPISEPVSDSDIWVTASAGWKLPALCRLAMKAGWDGVAPLAGIPGSIGGAVVMNAGTPQGTIGDLLETVTVLTVEGSLVNISKDRLITGYRTLGIRDSDALEKGGIVLSATLLVKQAQPAVVRAAMHAILVMRKARQPVGAPSAGSYFRNPAAGKPAGWLIEQAGLKGFRIGNAAVSEMHANFLINRAPGHANACRDMRLLAAHVQAEVSQRFSVLLEPEVRYVG